MQPAEIGPYQVLGKLGEGGMGEVYLARDRRLRRNVALKILPARFADDAERRARFTREARAAAALNHPRIAVIHDVGEHSGEDGSTIHFIVQELLEGETLRDRCGGRPMALPEVLHVATEVAEGLRAAHAAGIVHRDLKPDNIFLTSESGTKILDFGIAKLTESDPGGDASSVEDDASTGNGPPTSAATALVTSGEIVVGTVGYMAPEQVEGKPVDGRADVFAFGCVLYEMACGVAPFAAAGVAQTLSRILRDDPAPPHAHGVRLPPRLLWILDKCLAKDPDARYQGVADLVVDLRAADLDDEPVGGAPASAPAGRGRAATLAIGAMVALLGMAAGFVIGGNAMRESSAPVRRFEILTEDPQLTSVRGGRMVGISPDGTRVAYVDRSQLWLRSLDDGTARAVPDSADGVAPVFSPDGDWLAFGQDGQLRKLWLEGSDRFTLCDRMPYYGITWSEQDWIVLSDGEGLWKVQASGGECRPLGHQSRPDGRVHRSPQFLPGGDELLAWTLDAVNAPESGAADAGAAAILSAETGEVLAEIASDLSDPRYVESGHLIFRRGATLLAQEFDPATRRLSGDPIPVLDDLAFANQSHLDVSRTGTLVYVPTTGSALLSLVWVDREGRQERLSVEPDDYWAPRLDPAGENAAVVVRRPGSYETWLVSLDSPGVRERFEPGAFWPVWSTDGDEIYFVSAREITSSIWSRPVVGDRPPSRFVTPGHEYPYYVLAASHDPWVLAFYEMDPRSGRDILVVSPGGEPVEVVANPGFDGAPSLSPDARHLAYVSDKSGRREVYVRTCGECRPELDLPAVERRVSTSGGSAPTWSPDGTEIFFLSGGWMFAVAVDTRSDVAVSAPTALFRTGHQRDQFDNPNYSVAPDGRFLMLEPPDSLESRHRMRFVLGWFTELEELFAGTR